MLTINGQVSFSLLKIIVLQNSKVLAILRVKYIAASFTFTWDEASFAIFLYNCFLSLWVSVELSVFKTRANLSRIRRWFVGFIICHFLNKSFVSFELYELVCDKNVNTNKRKSTFITVHSWGLNTLHWCKPYHIIPEMNMFW